MVEFSIFYVLGAFVVLIFITFLLHEEEPD